MSIVGGAATHLRVFRSTFGRAVSSDGPDDAKPKPPKGGFRPDVEGLRAVAVGAVLLYHAGVPFASGGYVGVDVFFVISGFLITGLLVRELEKTDGISLSRFYSRRAKRLLPSTVVVCAFVVLVALALPLYDPVRMQELSLGVVASGLYVMNWLLAARATDYFAAVLVVSLAYSVYSTQAQAGAAYFSTLTRGWELALGGMLALVPTLGTAAIIAAGFVTTSAGASRVLTLGPVRHVGRISYSWYLWHWPLLVFASAIWGSLSRQRPKRTAHECTPTAATSRSRRQRPPTASTATPPPIPPSSSSATPTPCSGSPP